MLRGQGGSTRLAAQHRAVPLLTTRSGDRIHRRRQRR
jgi:hypothetical protein